MTTRAEQIDRERFERARDDVNFTWNTVARGHDLCRDCTGYYEVNVDKRCKLCAIYYAAKLRSVAIIAEPVALRIARRDGYANQ